MRVKVYGKRHMEGVSKKSGMPYNLNQVHYLGKDRMVEGYASQTCMLNADDYPYESIALNADYNLDFDNRGFVVDFSRIPASGGVK